MQWCELDGPTPADDEADIPSFSLLEFRAVTTPPTSSQTDRAVAVYAQIEQRNRFASGWLNPCFCGAYDKTPLCAVV